MPYAYVARVDKLVRFTRRSNYPYRHKATVTPSQKARRHRAHFRRRKPPDPVHPIIRRIPIVRLGAQRMQRADNPLSFGPFLQCAETRVVEIPLHLSEISGRYDGELYFDWLLLLMLLLLRLCVSESLSQGADCTAYMGRRCNFGSVSDGCIGRLCTSELQQSRLDTDPEWLGVRVRASVDRREVMLWDEMRKWVGCCSRTSREQVLGKNMLIVVSLNRRGLLSPRDPASLSAS